SACHDRVDPAQRALRRARPRNSLQVAGALLGGAFHLRAQLESQHVPVERGHVEQRTVVGVTFDPGGPSLLAFLQLLERARRTAYGVGLALTCGSFTERGLEFVLLLLVEGAGERLRLLLGDLVEPGGGGDTGTQPLQPRRDRQDFLTAPAGLG